MISQEVRGAAGRIVKATSTRLTMLPTRYRGVADVLPETILCPCDPTKFIERIIKSTSRKLRDLTERGMLAAALPDTYPEILAHVLTEQALTTFVQVDLGIMEEVWGLNLQARLHSEQILALAPFMLADFNPLSAIEDDLRVLQLHLANEFKDHFREVLLEVVDVLADNSGTQQATLDDVLTDQESNLGFRLRKDLAIALGSWCYVARDPDLVSRLSSVTSAPQAVDVDKELLRKAVDELAGLRGMSRALVDKFHKQ